MITWGERSRGGPGCGAGAGAGQVSKSGWAAAGGHRVPPQRLGSTPGAAGCCRAWGPRPHVGSGTAAASPSPFPPSHIVVEEDLGPVVVDKRPQADIEVEGALDALHPHVLVPGVPHHPLHQLQRLGALQPRKDDINPLKTTVIGVVRLRSERPGGRGLPACLPGRTMPGHEGGGCECTCRAGGGEAAGWQ